MSATAVRRPPCITDEQQYKADGHAPGDARRHVRALLGLWRLDRVSDDLEVVTSELVTNAVLHGLGGPLTLRLTRSATSVVVWVWDASPCPPRLEAVGDADESGRGFLIVYALSARVGWLPERGGKTVWAEVATDAPCPLEPGDLKRAEQSAGPNPTEEKARDKYAR